MGENKEVKKSVPQEKKHIKAMYNRPFEVNLVSSLGSTNYSWSLTKMTAGIFLLSTEIVPCNSNCVGGNVMQRFVFAFSSEIDTNIGTLEFNLLNLSSPSQITETKKITVDVKVSGEDNANKSDVSGFVQYSENSATYDETIETPVFKYNYPCADGGCVVKYSYPVTADAGCVVKYSYPAMAYNYMDSCCIEKYNFPVNNSCCNEKYGFPVMKYDYPKSSGCC